MSDWSDGYVQNIDYTYGYYTVMNPNRIRLAFLLEGLTPPKISTCCELGFGNGVTINIHNAASGHEWYGNDLNPGQVLYATHIASEGGRPLNLADDSFEEYEKRTDLPNFDFIALHGVWTYISPQSRAAIVSFIKKRLNPGGVVYISYNLLAGWARFLPIRNLMTSEQNDFKSQNSNQRDAIRGGMKMIDDLIGVQARFFLEDPKSLALFEGLKSGNIDYVAHELFHQNWNLMNFSDCSKELEQAKLNYACSANYMDHLSSIDMTGKQQELVRSVSSVSLREDMHDVMRNRRYRMDYWIKGGLPLKPQEQLRLIREQRVVLSTDPGTVTSDIPDLAGMAGIDPAIYHHFADALSGHAIHSLGSLADQLQPHGLSIIHVIHIAMAMIQRRYAELVQDDEAIALALPSTRRFNNWVLARARHGTEQDHKFGREISYLASPVSGGGITVSRVDQLFLLATMQGATKPAALADFAWGILSGLGEKLTKDDKLLETDAKNLAHMRKAAKDFRDKLLPVMIALKII